MKSHNAVNVKVDGNTVNVSGRSYKSAHVLIIGASQLEMQISPSHVEIRATFSDLPEILDSTPHLLRVSAPSASLELDVDGRRISKVREEGSDVIVEGEALTFKFETDTANDSVILKIPRLTPLRVSRALVKASSGASVNAIIDPFILGIVTIYISESARISLSGQEKVASITA